MIRSIVRFAIALFLCVPLTAASVSVAQTAPTRPRVAILLFNGAEIIDFSGPYEVFGAAGYDVYTVAETKAPITTAMGMTVVPKYDFSDVPHPDILLVPGGRITQPRGDPKTLDWIRATTAAVKHTISVCNGAIILADAGLLDGLSATTTDGWIPRMRKAYPTIHVVDDQRFVDNGKIITTAGLSAGIDGALHVVEVSSGKSEAQQVALGLEYNWQPDHAFVRAALADKQFPDFNLDPVGDWSQSSTGGDRTHWHTAFDGGKGKDAAQVMSYVADRLQTVGKWKHLSSSGNGRKLASAWTFTGQDGQPWNGTVAIEPLKSDTGDYRITFAVARKSEGRVAPNGD